LDESGNTDTAVVDMGGRDSIPSSWLFVSRACLVPCTYLDKGVGAVGVLDLRGA